MSTIFTIVYLPPCYGLSGCSINAYRPTKFHNWVPS